jgi:hypothetical protein
MHLRRRLSAARLRRILDRAQAAPAALANPLIELRDRDPVHERCQPGGASALCGTWADKPRGRRHNERVKVESEISLRRLGSFPFEVRLGDLSAGGCKIEMIEFVEVDDHVVARFPGIEPLGARVSWSDERWAGIDFDRPMHPAVFEQLLTRLS